MVGVVDTPSPQAPELGFSISHQKLELDIDILSRSLKGSAELTIIPHSKDLKAIRLNCRQCELKRLTINGKVASSSAYHDPYQSSKIPWHASVHQYHMLRRKLEGQLKLPPEPELVVNLPKSIRIDEIDQFSPEGVNLFGTKAVGTTKRDSEDGGAIDAPQGTRAGAEQTARFTPLTLSVEYIIKEIRDGMQFIGWDEGDLRYPHAYTKNSLFPGTACCLFPCSDEISARCTWEISIRCSKSIGDALDHHHDSKGYSLVNGSHDSKKGINGISNVRQEDETAFNFSDEDKALELAVICTGEMTDEVREADVYERI